MRDIGGTESRLCCKHAEWKLAGKVSVRPAARDRGLPQIKHGVTSVELRPSEFAMLLDDIDMSRAKRMPRYERTLPESVNTRVNAGWISNPMRLLLVQTDAPPATFKFSGLPNDAASLKAMLLASMSAHEQEKQRADQQRYRTESLQKKPDDLDIANLCLQVEVDRFKRRYCGPRADRLSATVELGQMLPTFAEEFDSRPVNQGDHPKGDAVEEQPRRIRKSRGRRNLKNSDKLPVRQHVHELRELGCRRRETSHPERR